MLCNVMEDLMEACKWKKTKLMEFNGLSFSYMSGYKSDKPRSIN